MLYNSRQQGLIIERCWLIYELVSDKLVPLNEFHIRYPNLVEFALTSGYFKLLVEIGGSGHSIHIYEEYEFAEYKLVLKAYVYILFDKAKNSIIRADSLPHHRLDYKGHRLAHFPNHLHDEMGRICSFSGRIEDFVRRCCTISENAVMG